MPSDFLSSNPDGVQFGATFQLADGALQAETLSTSGVLFVLTLQALEVRFLTQSGPQSGPFGTITAAGVASDGKWGNNTQAALYACAVTSGMTLPAVLAQLESDRLARTLSETSLQVAAWLLAGPGAVYPSIQFARPVTPPRWNTMPPRTPVRPFAEVVVSRSAPTTTVPSTPLPASTNPEAPGPGTVAPVPAGPGLAPVRPPAVGALATAALPTPWATYALAGIATLGVGALVVLALRTPPAPPARVPAYARAPQRRAKRNTRG